MSKITGQEELTSLQGKFMSEIKAEPVRILVCAGTGCQASGSLNVYEKR